MFIADVPVDVNESTKGDQLLEVPLPDEMDIEEYELVQGAPGYREWSVPLSC